MRVKFSPFRITDLSDLEIQGRHAYIRPFIWRNYFSLRPRMEGPFSWTAWDPYGRPLACGGILPDGVAWAFLGKDLRRHMVACTRAVRTVLEAHPGPVFADIDETHPEALRWARLLGFRRTREGLWLFRRNNA